MLLIYVDVCIWRYIYIYIYIHMWKCVYVHVYICIIYMHISINNLYKCYIISSNNQCKSKIHATNMYIKYLWWHHISHILNMTIVWQSYEMSTCAHTAMYMDLHEWILIKDEKMFHHLRFETIERNGQLPPDTI